MKNWLKLIGKIFLLMTLANIADEFIPEVKLINVSVSLGWIAGIIYMAWQYDMRLK